MAIYLEILTLKVRGAPFLQSRRQSAEVSLFRTVHTYTIFVGKNTNTVGHWQFWVWTSLE